MSEVAYARKALLTGHARLAVGYASFDTPPPDFHAVFEAFGGGRGDRDAAQRVVGPSSCPAALGKCLIYC
jgi:hypothetical protein